MSSPGKGGKGKKGSVTASVATGLPNPEQMVTGGTAEPAKAGLTVKPVAVTQEECESAADAVMPLEGGELGHLWYECASRSITGGRGAQ